MGALFKYSNMPICDLRVTLSPERLLSTKQLIPTGLPRDGGELGGRYSTASVYISFIALIRDWTNAGSLT